VYDLFVRRYSSPIGSLTLAATDRGLAWIGFPTRGAAADLKRWKERHRFRPVNGENEFLSNAIDELDAYFDGTLRQFRVRLDIHGTEFQRQVWRGLRRIRYGRTVSYSELAGQIGRPGAQRAVGRANGQNGIPIIIPCHRVINAAGDLHGFGGGLHRKAFLLDHEKAVVTRARDRAAVTVA
jgi:AraC family transcriptional regulator of adaptative response/methylated-DNA-[protein]-cysteine methyltransferase